MLDAVEESEVSKGGGSKRWMEVVKKEGSCDGRSKLVSVFLSWKFCQVADTVEVVRGGLMAVRDAMKNVGCVGVIMDGIICKMVDGSSCETVGKSLGWKY